MKKAVKILLIIIPIVLLLLAAGLIGYSHIQKQNKITRIAFYDLTEKNSNLIKKILLDINNSEEPQLYEFIVLDSSKPLKSQLTKKIDAVYTNMGQNALDAANFVSDSRSDSVCMREDLLTEATVSVKQKAVYNQTGKISVVPLQLDLCQIDIDRRYLFQCKVEYIRDWADIENFALKAQKIIHSPIVFAGGNPDAFLSVFGAITEAFSGKQSLDKAMAEIQKIPDYTKTPDMSREKLEPVIKELSDKKGKPFFESTQLLHRWMSLGLLDSNIYNYTISDVLNLMADERAPIAFLTLSEHRLVKFPASNSYSSIYYPSSIEPLSRFFSAPVICAVPLKDKPSVKAGIEYLVSEAGQTNLVENTGLAPILATSRVVDHQADDARYWIAATNPPVAPFADYCLCSDSAKKMLADVIIDYIKNIN